MGLKTSFVLAIEKCVTFFPNNFFSGKSLAFHEDTLKKVIRAIMPFLTLAVVAGSVFSFSIRPPPVRFQLLLWGLDAAAVLLFRFLYKTRS